MGHQFLKQIVIERAIMKKNSQQLILQLDEKKHIGGTID